MATSEAGARTSSPGRRTAGHAPVLLPVGGRPPLGVYLNQLFRRWPFALAQARAQATTANRGMVLGNMWLVLSPLLDAAVYYLIFEIVLSVSRGVPNFVGYLIIGVFLFKTSSQSISSSVGLVLANKGLIRAFAFPRASLPLALVTRITLNSIPTVIVMLIIVYFLPESLSPGPTWLLFPAVLALQVVLNLGLALVVARVTDDLPDLGKFISVVSRILLYVSCVIFPDDRIRQLPGGDILLDVNPIFHILDISRDLLLYDTYPEVRSWLILTAWSVGLVCVGFVYFWRGEVNYGRS